MSDLRAAPRAAPSSRRNLRLLAARSFLYGLQTNMVRAVWQPFVLSLGTSMPLLGLLESIGGFQGVVSTAAWPVGGWLSDRRGRKPLAIVGSVFGAAALLVYALAGWAEQWLVLLPGVILLGLSSVARPVFDCLVAESAAPEMRGAAFGLASTGFAVAGILAPAFGGLLADRTGFVVVFLVGAGLELIVLGLLALALRETLPRELPIRASDFVGALPRIISPSPRLRWFYIAVAVDLIAFGTGSSILFGLLTREYGFSTLQLGLLSSALSLTWAGSQWFVGRKVDHHGSIPFLILSEAIAMVVCAGWLMARSFLAFLLLHAVLGLAVAAWVPSFLSWIAGSVPEGSRAEEMGRLGAFRGLLSFPAPYIGGLLYDLVGFRGPILANLIGAGVVILILWRLVGEPAERL